MVERLDVILTGSGDCSARLWTMEGQFVETLCDGHTWVLASEPTGSSIRLLANAPRQSKAAISTAEIDAVRLSFLNRTFLYCTEFSRCHGYLLPSVSVAFSQDKLLKDLNISTGHQTHEGWSWMWN